MPFTEDLSVFYATDDLGTAASWNSATVNGIFDNDYEDPLGAIQGRHAIFRTGEAMMPGLAVGQTITINAIAYKAREIQPHASGEIIIHLGK